MHHLLLGWPNSWSVLGIRIGTFETPGKGTLSISHKHQFSAITIRQYTPELSEHSCSVALHQVQHKTQTEYQCTVWHNCRKTTVSND